MALLHEPANVERRRARPDMETGMDHMSSMQVESPCTGVCTLDSDGYCHGCRRTGSEIAAWMTLSTQEKCELLVRLQERQVE